MFVFPSTQKNQNVLITHANESEKERGRKRMGVKMGFRSSKMKFGVWWCEEDR